MVQSDFIQAVKDMPAYATVPEGTTMEDLCTQLYGEAISGELPSNSHIELGDNSDNDVDDNGAGSETDTPSAEVNIYTIHMFDEAIRVSHDLLVSLTTKGEESLAEDLLSVIQGLHNSKWRNIKSTRQSTLLEFINLNSTM